MLLDRSVIHDVPVFGLRDYVLFPATLAALQVFEVSLTNLVDDALAADRLIVVCGIAPAGFAHGTLPALYPVGGLAKILNVQRQEDGSRLVYLHGLERVRIVRFRREIPYPTAQVEVLADAVQSRERLHLRRAERRLQQYLDALMALPHVQRRELAQVVASTQDPAVLSYRLAAVLLRDPAERQAFLEEPSPLSRLQTLTEAVGGVLLAEGERAPVTTSMVN